MSWAEDKIKEAIEILRNATYPGDSDADPSQEGAKLHPYDLSEAALWSRDPDLRDNRGYLEAWADVADLTVGQFIEFVEADRYLNVNAYPAVLPKKEG